MMNSVLVHLCCVHCSAYTLKFWQQQGYRVSAFWFNPNIHPEKEHFLRLEAVRSLLAREDIELVEYPRYEPHVYFESIKNRDIERCSACVRLRMQKTATEALKLGFTAFTSSLLISPQQAHDETVLAGDEAAGSTGLLFLYSDLRRRYSDSRVITKGMDFYRQHYCGCIYSLGEAGG